MGDEAQRFLQVTFEPRLDILPQSQLRLWPELEIVPSDFVLYGGAGPALQLGHRFSEDFDFFFDDRFRSCAAAIAVAFLPGFRPKWRGLGHHETDNLAAFVDRGGL
jgi:hypothetical protein